MMPNKRRDAAQFYAERLMGVADDRGAEHMYPPSGQPSSATVQSLRAEQARQRQIDAQQPTPAQWRAYQQQLAQQRMMESYREPPSPTYADPQPAPPGQYREPVRQVFTHVPFPYPNNEPAYVVGDWRSQMEESISRTQPSQDVGPYVSSPYARMLYPDVRRVAAKLPKHEQKSVSSWQHVQHGLTPERTQRELAKIEQREEQAAFAARLRPTPGEHSIGTQFPRTPSPVPFAYPQPPDVPPVPYALEAGEQYVPADWWSMLRNDMKGRPEAPPPPPRSGPAMSYWQG